MKFLLAILISTILSNSLSAETNADHAAEKNPGKGKKPATVNPKLISKPTGRILPEKLGIVNELKEAFNGEDETRTTFEVADAIEKVSRKIQEAAQRWGNAPKNLKLAKQHYNEILSELISLNAKFCGSSSGNRVTAKGKETPKSVTPLKGLFDEAK